MTYADSRYISVARKSELVHHEHAMEQLRVKVEQLSKAVTWELQQHQTRLQELQQVEETLSAKGLPMVSKGSQPTLKPIQSSARRSVHTRKYTHQSLKKSIAELVG